MDAKKYAGIIRNRYTKLHSDHTPIFDEVERYHQMYRVALEQPDKWEWDYTYTDPVVFYLIRNVMSKLNPEAFRVKLEARNERDIPAKEINQQIINWELSEMAKTLLFYNFIFRGILAGRTYMKTGWEFNKGVTIKINDDKQKIMRDIVNRGTAMNIRFQDLFIPNRNIPTMEDQPYIIERIMMRYGEMLDENEAQGREVWKKQYLDKIKEKKMFETKMDYGIDLVQTDDGEHSKEDTFIRSQYVSLIKMRTHDHEEFYIPAKDEDWILNKETDCKYWHGHYEYISWAPFPEDDDFFSMGFVQPIADFQESLTETLNQYLTNARKAGNPMWIAGSSASQTPDWMFVNRPDGIIRVQGDPNQVTQVRHIDTAETMITMRRELMTSFERTVGMSSMLQAGVGGGNTPQLNKTATGARIMDSNMETNIQMLITLLGSQALSKLGEHLLELNAQYITEEQQIKITDRNGIQYVNVHPEQITANFDVMATPDTMTKDNPVVKQAQLLNLKGTIDAEKDVKFDKKPIWKAIFAAFPEMESIDNMILDPEQQAKEAIQLMLDGVEPEITINMDHKAVATLVQVFMLSNEELDEQTLLLFTKYLDNLRKYTEAQKVLFTMEQPLTPTDPKAMMPQMGSMGADMGGGAPRPLPTGEQDLMKSLMGQSQMASNPTEGLEYKLPEESIL
jgi:hypothetical protein